MEPVVLVHLSDIHFTGKTDQEAYRNESTRRDLIRDLKRMRDIVGDAKAVVVTGDIANTGAQQEYEVAGRWLDEVSEVVGNDPAAVFTVPGNHDVDCTKVGASAKLGHQLLRTCRSDDLDDELASLLADPARPLLTKLDNYNNFAAQYGCEVNEKNEPWEASIPLGGGYDLVVRGLCSVFNSDRDDQESLIVGKRQTTLLAEEGKIYLLLSHHGPGDLRDADTVRSKIRDRAVMMLSGHRHAQRTGDYSGCVEVCAGAVNPKEETGYFAEYNWIRLTLSDADSAPRLKIELWHRQWKETANVFGTGSTEGEAEIWERPLPQYAILPPGATQAVLADITSQEHSLIHGSDDEAPSIAVSGSASISDVGDLSPDGTPALRPPIESETGEISLERRVRQELFRLASKTAQVRVLSDLNLIAEEDWGKPFVTMVANAITTAASLGLLVALHERVQIEAEEAR